MKYAYASAQDVPRREAMQAALQREEADGLKLACQAIREVERREESEPPDDVDGSTGQRPLYHGGLRTEGATATSGMAAAPAAPAVAALLAAAHRWKRARTF